MNEPVKPNDLLSLQHSIDNPNIAKDSIGRVLSVPDSEKYEVEFWDERSSSHITATIAPEQTLVFKHHTIVTDDRFWQMIDKAREQAQGDGEQLTQVLIDDLATLSLADILTYDTLFHEYRNTAYINELWAAAYVICGGCGDDEFMDFRAWLIAQGKSAYENALRDPETLVDVAPLVNSPYGAYGDTQLESMNYVASYAYEKKTGKDMPVFYGIHPLPDLAGADWEEDEAYTMYPNLAAKFGEDDAE